MRIESKEIGIIPRQRCVGREFDKRRSGGVVVIRRHIVRNEKKFSPSYHCSRDFNKRHL